MFTLQQSLSIKGSAGDPLPSPWPSLAAKGTVFLRGQLALVCAAPGIGKSAFTLAYALKARVPTLYFSADSDAYTQLTRSVSSLTGWSLERSSEMVRSGDLNGATPLLADIPIRFNYSASPSIDQIKNSMMAYDEVYGDFPQLVVVDNITNVRTGAAANDEDPYAGLEVLMEYLHDMARQTSAFVAGLHHVTGPYNDGNKPIPLSGIKGQIGRVPELVLTLHRPLQQFGNPPLNVSTVKNRSGKSDPSGQAFVSLDFDGARMQIT